MGQDEHDQARTEPDGRAAARQGRRVGRMLGVGMAVLVLAGLTIAAGAGLYLYRQLTEPGPLAAETVVVVPHGASVARIAGVLAESGVIADPASFEIGARLLARQRPLRAGEFAFAPGISAIEAMRLLQAGRTVMRSLTVPEGLTTAQVLDLVGAAAGLRGEPPRPPGEGLLLPETYHYAWGDGATEMVARMRRAMEEALAELWLSRAEGLPFVTPEEALALASIVEKETSLAEERPRIAAVFLNRLRRGMRLQSDPTVAFALAQAGGPLGRPLTRDDLQVQHPYNTYVVDGLPPGPIANPGRASLEAVLHPADSEELYFVADGNGGHAFAKNLKEHQRNVAKWRRLNRR